MVVLRDRAKRTATVAICSLISRTAVAVLIVGCFGPPQLDAQTLGAPTHPVQAAWLSDWSPLAGTADLPRQSPGFAATLPSLLTQPGPRVGLFWTAGNPASLPFETRDSYAQIRAGYDRNSGDYRRPLDPGTDRRAGVSAQGWKPLTARGAAIGHIVVERMRQSEGAYANAVVPYSSNPFTALDTIGDAMSGMVVRLEGGAGWTLGNLGLGLTIGYDGREVRSEEALAPRLDRVSATGATVGVAYDFFDGALRVGLFGREERTAQTVQVYAAGGGSVVYVLSGYYEPVPFEVNVGSTYFWRRFDREARAYGASVGGRVAGISWTGAALLNRVTEGQYVDRYENVPNTDDWDADGWSLVFAAQRTLGDNAFLATVPGRYTELDGEAVRADLGEVSFTARESAVHVSAELRMLPRNGWQAALSYGLAREDRVRHDLLARVGSDVKHWAPALALEVARTLPGGFAISVGGGYSQYAPWGGIPSPNRMSDPYRRWIAPEYAQYGTEATTRTGSLTVLWRQSEKLSVWARGSLASLSPKSTVGQLQFAPGGSRTHGGIELGVTMGGRGG